MSARARENMSIRINLFKNGFAIGLQKLVRVAEQLVLVPFFLSAWGASAYGEWITLTAIPSVFALSDFGFGTAAANAFVLRFAAGDRQGAARVAKAGFVMTAVSVGILIFGFVIFGSAFRHFSNAPKPLLSETSIAVVALLMTARFTIFFTQLLEAFFRSARQAALFTHLFSLYAIVKLLASIMILRLGYGPIALSLVELLSTIVYTVVCSIVAFRLIPGLDIWSVPNAMAESRELLKKGFSYLMSPAWQAIFFQGTTLVVRGTLGLEMVTLFNTVRTLCRSLNQAFSLINNAILPELQFEVGAGRMESARRLFRLGVGLASATGLVGVIVMWWLGPIIYREWTHGLLTPPPGVWAAFLVGVAINALWGTASMTFRAVNRPEGFAVVGILAAIISVFLSWILSGPFGLLGATLGSLALEVIMLLYVLPVSSALLGQKLLVIPAETYRDFRNVWQKFEWQRLRQLFSSAKIR